MFNNFCFQHKKTSLDPRTEVFQLLSYKFICLYDKGVYTVQKKTLKGHKNKPTLNFFIRVLLKTQYAKPLYMTAQPLATTI